MAQEGPVNCIVQQFQFMILNVLNENTNFQEKGIDCETFISILKENEPLWMTAGLESELKVFPTSIRRNLSTLTLEKALQKNDKGFYSKGEKFDEYLENLALDLDLKLDLDIYFDGETIKFNLISEQKGKNKLILVHDQLISLCKIVLAERS